MWKILVFTILNVLLLQNAFGINGRRRRSTLEKVTFWPDGIIPYTLDPDQYSESQIQLIQRAMSYWEFNTCVKFVPWTSELQQQFGQTRNMKFLYVQASCFSRTGMHRIQPQVIGLGGGCMSLKIIIHELGHAIGLLHTMEREDRDHYLEVYYENINEDSYGNFDHASDKGIDFETFRLPYDYKSVMHYAGNIWNIGDSITMSTKDQAYQNIIGRSNFPSFYDYVYVNRAYNCSRSCSYLRCRNGGELVKTGDGNCYCLCQDGYTGERCQKKLPGYERIVDWKCEDEWGYKNGKCYWFKSMPLNYQTSESFCQYYGATLLTIKTMEEARWIKFRLQDYLKDANVPSAWLGVEREANTNNYTWIDGSPYNTAIMPLHELGTTEERGCGLTDGVSTVITSCTNSTRRAVVCMKDFDSRCGGRFRLRKRPVQIAAPAVESSYPASTSCQYFLEAPVGKGVSIHFDTFSLGTTDDCSQRYIELQESVLQTGTRYCGNSLQNKTFTTNGRFLILNYVTEKRFSTDDFVARASPISIQTPPKTTSAPGFLDDFFEFTVGNSSTNEENNDASLSYLESLLNIFRSLTISDIY